MSKQFRNIYLVRNTESLAFIKAIPDDATDEELVHTYKTGGDLAVLGRLYSKYMDLVFGVCMKYLEDTELAKDATMQIFEELIDKLIKHEVQVFRSWLYTVARNHCLMKLRAGKNRRVVPFDTELMQSGDSSHPEEGMAKEEALVHLESCIETLKDEQQRVVKLFYLEEKSYNEIVTRTGLEWNLVRSLVQNGRRNLKICMERKSAGSNFPQHEKRVDQ